jgi:pyridoxal phosphate enzyme (YggS family)
VNGGLSTLSGRLAGVRERISAAARRSDRAPDAVRLVAVTKTVPPDVVAQVVALGVRDLGENRVQEADRKIQEVGRTAPDGAPLNWHLIGHLQRNKAGRAVELFDRIHGVDGLEVAEALSRRAASAERRLRILIEVNVSGEASKFGVAPEALPELLESVAALDGLELEGLMTVGPPVREPGESRPHFARLRTLRDAAEVRLHRKLPELSMGMSGDFEVAVEEGATLVRVGTALFGARS